MVSELPSYSSQAVIYLFSGLRSNRHIPCVQWERATLSIVNHSFSLPFVLFCRRVLAREKKSGTYQCCYKVWLLTFLFCNLFFQNLFVKTFFKKYFFQIFFQFFFNFFSIFFSNVFPKIFVLKILFEHFFSQHFFFKFFSQNFFSKNFCQLFFKIFFFWKLYSRCLPVYRD